MRALFLAAAAALVATPAFAQNLAPLPFPVERGSALPPPAVASTRAAPPEGVGAAGLDFGQWRGVNPDYSTAFQTQIRARYLDVDIAAARADLEANGFSCADAGRLDCRIEIVEAGCAHDWYVVVERAQAAPVAGFDRVCLNAGRDN